MRELGEHFAAGRLEPHEYDERVAQAYTARTQADLDRLFTDLPRPQEEPQPAAPPAAPAGVPPVFADAPYGREPATGIPYSDRSKIIAGLLQILVPFGIGRFYMGNPGIGVLQALLAIFGIGAIWSMIDGIVILAGRPTDRYGRPLRS